MIPSGDGSLPPEGITTPSLLRSATDYIERHRNLEVVVSDQQGQEANLRWQEQHADAEKASAHQGPPAVSALKDEWVAWAVRQGADDAVAGGLTKQELVDRYGDGGSA